MAKIKKEAGTEDNQATAPQAATRPEETEEKGGQEGGADAEGHEDTGVDQGGETPATGGQGLSDGEEAIMKEITASAKKVFATHPVSKLWFTTDLMGFGNETDAANHAATLRDHTIVSVDRNDLYH